MTEHFTANMDPAVEQEGCNTGTVPMFDSVHFPQWTFMYPQDPFNGAKDLMKGFLLQSQIYFDRLLNPKPKEKQWTMFLLSEWASTTKLQPGSDKAASPVELPLEADRVASTTELQLGADVAASHAELSPEANIAASQRGSLSCRAPSIGQQGDLLSPGQGHSLSSIVSC